MSTMESAMAVVAEHAKVETLTLEGRIRASPMVEDLEFFDAFIKACLIVTETLMESPHIRVLASGRWITELERENHIFKITRELEFLDCLEDPCQKFCDAVEGSDVPRVTETRSYILANIVLEMYKTYDNIEVTDAEWKRDLIDLLSTIYFVMVSLQADEHVTPTHLTEARNVLQRLDTLQHRASILALEAVLTAHRHTSAGH